MHKKKRKLAAMAVTALALIDGATAAAHAAGSEVSAIATTSSSTVGQDNADVLAAAKVSGSRSCGPDEQV
jgi:hypothetical protein